jgi:hypothetical protein
MQTRSLATRNLRRLVAGEWAIGVAMGINDFLAPSQVAINRHASDKVRSLDHLARRAAVALDLPHEMILSALLKREELGSTGTGDGVAVPHARLLGVNNIWAACPPQRGNRLRGDRWRAGRHHLPAATADKFGRKNSTRLHVPRESCGIQNHCLAVICRQKSQKCPPSSRSSSPYAQPSRTKAH